MSNEANVNQFVRDLVWAVSSAPLLRCEGEGAVAPLEPARVDGDRLAEFLRERSDHRVGHYFENLVHFWLKHVRGVEMVAHREPVRNGERTLGELDFIFRDEAGRLTHWEVAVKFYLLTKAADGPQRFLGPNTTDSLERKIARMRDHQLPLSGRVYGGIAARRAFVKGRIYYHSTADRRVAGLPELHPAHLEGVWLHRNEVVAFAESNPHRARGFAVLKKPFWLTASADCCSIEELERVVERHYREAANAMHVALFGRNGEELQRLFIVPDSWPGICG